MAKLLYLISEDWFFCSHFLERAVAARAAGFEVAVLTRESRHGQRIRDAGIRLLPLAMDRSSTSPLREMAVLWRIWRTYGRERPDLVHHVALKPILYGSIAARWCGLRAVLNAPVGMGYLFTSNDARVLLLRPLVSLLLKALLNPRGSCVVFENPEDLRNSVDSGTVRAADAVLIQGAGIDTDLFRPADPPRGVASVPVVVMGARMLRDKGVAEYVRAARMLHERGVAARFLLVGAPDPSNPSSFSQSQLQAWHAQGDVEWLGHQDDMAPLLRGCDIACLPSYREGLPKFLLEAMACGLPVVSTDVTGCRHAVDAEVTGLLVPPRDPLALANALAVLLADRALRLRLGTAGRQRVITRFSSESVIAQTLAQYQVLSTSA